MTGTTWRGGFALTTAFLLALLGFSPSLRTKGKTSFPTWWGPVDVALALVLAISAFGIQGLVREEVDKQAKETTPLCRRLYQVSRPPWS